MLGAARRSATTTTPRSTPSWPWRCSRSSATGRAARPGGRSAPSSPTPHWSSTTHHPEAVPSPAVGRNPDVEVTRHWPQPGFEHVAAPRWSGSGTAFTWPSASGTWPAGPKAGRWPSRRCGISTLAAGRTPAQAGGDFAAEAHRLGRMTAEMHLAMAACVRCRSTRGSASSDGSCWSTGIEDGLAAAALTCRGRVGEVVERRRAVRDPGPAIRVHGDYHLGQVMRTDTGWYVLDFEGEPARPLEERIERCSPLKDVTGMLRRSTTRAGTSCTERSADEAASLEPLAGAWEARNRPGIFRRLPRRPGIDELLLGAAGVRAGGAARPTSGQGPYELAYERAYRPDWVTSSPLRRHRHRPGWIDRGG